MHLILTISVLNLSPLFLRDEAHLSARFPLQGHSDMFLLNTSMCTCNTKYIDPGWCCSQAYPIFVIRFTLAVLHCSRRVVKNGKACMGTLTFITCSTSNSDSRLPAFTILLLSCTTVNSNHRRKKVSWPGNEARPGHPEHHNGNCAFVRSSYLCKPHNYCMCLPSI